MHVACNLCGADDAAEVARRGRGGRPVRNVICRRCTLVYVDPRPTPEELGAWYRERYHGLYGGVGALLPDGEVAPPGSEACERWRREGLELRTARVREWAGLRPGARVLEIGSRGGDLLRRLRETCGAEILGVEPGAEEARASSAAGVPTFAGTFEDLPAPERPFDAILAFHVLEHLADPLAALRRARALLAPDGVLIVEVPNLYRPYGGLEENFFQDAHLTTFSPWTLDWMLERAGFAPRTLAVNVLASVARVAEPRAPDFAEGEGAQAVLEHLEGYRRWFAVDALRRARGWCGETDAACRHLDAAPGALPWKRLAFADVGCDAVERGDHAAGLRWLERAVACGTSDPEILVALVQLSLARRDGARARGWLARLHAAEPGHPQVVALQRACAAAPRRAAGCG